MPISLLQELKRNGYPIRQSLDSKNRLKLRLKHKLGGIAGFACILHEGEEEKRESSENRLPI
jgi:hypothetical protein